MRKVYVETYGCQMNEHDSERMLSILKEDGYGYTDNPKDADVIIINTCSVREKAEHKAYSSLGRYMELKHRKHNKVVVFSGCVAQQDGKELIKTFKDVDVIVGPSNVHRIGELIARIDHDGHVIATSENTCQSRFKNPVKNIIGIKAYVTIMEGCNNFCTYCTVPYLRGREVSRDAREIVDEVYALAGSGVKEIILLGQNVNSYMDQSTSLYELLSMLNDINGIERIRFITSHPKDLTDKLMRAFADFGKVCPHIHLPVQSGSDRILKLMARGYTTSDYIKKIEKLRNIKPDMAITSDFIVGFPSETYDDHYSTILFIKQVIYDNIFSFKYSDRLLAKASRFDNKVGDDDKAGRLKELHETQLGITKSIYSSLVNTVQRVFVEGKSKKQGRMQGRTGHNRIVNFEGAADPGEVVDVLINDYSDNALYGSVKNKKVNNVN